MADWAGKLRASEHHCALGAKSGTVEMRVRSTVDHASILRDVTTPEIVETYPVELRRYDELFPAVDGPALVKIDVEGAEMDLLEGMTGVLGSIDVIVVETSLNTLFEGGADFPEVLAFLRGHGMALFDFLDIKRRPFDGALHQLDAVFVREDSPVRVKRWA